METLTQFTPHADLARADYPELSVGRLMDPPLAVFLPHFTVGEATEMVRTLAAGPRLFTYGHIVDFTGRLMGVITMRDLLLNEKSARLEDFMIRQPFSIRASMPLLDAMKLTVNKHFPSYPVCDDSRRLVGVIRGATMFEAQTIEI